MLAVDYFWDHIEKLVAQYGCYLAFHKEIPSINEGKRVIHYKGFE